MKQKSEFDARRYVQLFMAGYVPRSKDEKKFVDKHVAQLHQDVNGNKDDVFKATNIPTHKRPPYHGYEKGNDERMYESVKMDPHVDTKELEDSSFISNHVGKNGHRAEVRHNKNMGDYTVHHYLDDIHMGMDNVTYHEKQSQAEREARYSTHSINSHYTAAKKQPTLDNALKDLKQLGKNRKWDVGKTIDRKDRAFPEVGDGRYTIPSVKTEEVEQIDEWSKWKLLSYINRATNDLRSKSFKAGLDPYDHPGTPVGDAFQRNSQKRDKRQIGIGKAASKLAFGKVSENAEQIDEMNKSALSDKDLYHPKSIMRVKGYNKMNEPIQSAQIQSGTNIVSEHEGEGGHVAQVRYSDVRKEYQVHHYTNGYNLGEHPISYHDTKKDAVDTAKYTTTVRNHDYLDRHEVLAGRVGKGSAYGVEPKGVNEEMSDAQMAKRERIVKSMKKKAGTFEKRYGDKAKDVMYATATKMAMEDLDYVNLDMTDAVADLLESEHNLVGKQKNIDKNNNGKMDGEDFKMLRDQKGMKHIENQAKKVREVTKKYPIAQRDESVIEQILGKIGTEETVEIEFNSGEVVEITSELAESIINVFMDLTEENQAKFEDLISEDLVSFEDALSFIAEAFEGNE
jgi:hypothetical protein